MSANILDHLTAFIAVAETGSFSVAARNLNRAVSSISYSVTQLEAQCGFRLLERRAKRSELTERGRALFGEAKAVVDGTRRFSSHAASLERGAETRIQIAVDVVFPLADLHAALKSFVTIHERVQLQLFTSSLNNLWDELRSRSFDFALSLVAAIPLDMEGCSFRQITLGPIASASHPLALLKRPLSLSDLQRERQIYFVGSPHIALERVGRVFSLDVLDCQRPRAHPAVDPQRLRLVLRDRGVLRRGAPCRIGANATLQRCSAAADTYHQRSMVGRATARTAGPRTDRAYRASLVSDAADESLTKVEPDTRHDPIRPLIRFEWRARPGSWLAEEAGGPVWRGQKLLIRSARPWEPSEKRQGTKSRLVWRRRH